MQSNEVSSNQPRTFDMGNASDRQRLFELLVQNRHLGLCCAIIRSESCDTYSRDIHYAVQYVLFERPPAFERQRHEVRKIELYAVVGGNGYKVTLQKSDSQTVDLASNNPATAVMVTP